jgi:hypothetical protein
VVDLKRFFYKEICNSVQVPSKFPCSSSFFFLFFFSLLSGLVFDSWLKRKQSFRYNENVFCVFLFHSFAVG